MTTTKWQAERAILEVEILTELAATTVRSMTPTGLGPDFEKERKELEVMLDEVGRRFRKVIKAGQRRGWARE